MTPPTTDIEQTDDRVLLEGAYSRRRELWLVLRAVRDFIAGFRVLHFVGPCVTIFGSARISEGHPYYALAREVGRRVSLLGFGVLTGGGPGLMEAANRGARDAGGFSGGCNIELGHEQQPNAYLDRWLTCHYFFVRKVLLFKYSYAFIGMPGGFGTLDELAEALTLVQTAKILNYPIVLMGVSYWRPLLDQMQQMVREGTLAEADVQLIFATDDIDDVVAHLRTHAIDAFQLRARPGPKPSRLLGERALWEISRSRADRSDRTREGAADTGGSSARRTT
jgi:uncharacterized protein (TIGR00730 family)